MTRVADDMATPALGQQSKVLCETGVSAEDMERQLEEFLGRRHVVEGLSSEDYTRLQALREALKEEAGARVQSTSQTT